MKNKSICLFSVWRVCKYFLPVLSLSIAVLFCSCKAKDFSLFEYVSECRSNIFIGENDGVTVKANAVSRETPYLSDGSVGTVSPRVEVFISGISESTPCDVYFSIDDAEYGGDAFYLATENEYRFYMTLDVSARTEIPFRISTDTGETVIVAKSVLTPSTLSPNDLLTKIRENENERFSKLISQNGFAGEIRIRLIDKYGLYYFVGITDLDGNTYSVLADAETGKILATRESRTEP